MEKWHHRFEIKPGKWVYHPTDTEMVYGLEVLEFLRPKVRLPSSYHHLRSGGHVLALRRHLESRFFLKLDISGFFDSIGRSRVARVLKPFYGYREAFDVATRSTVKHPNSSVRVLPYGYVQSMLLASIVLYQSSLGKYLISLEAKNSCVVSVYVDDIIVSGDDLSELKRLFAQLLIYTERSRFSLNLKKTQFPSGEIEAFNIILSYGSMQIKKDRLNEFLVALKEAKSQDEVDGIKNYVKSINYNQWALL